MKKGKYVLFDEEQALKVFTILCNAWHERNWIFRDITLPEDQFKNQLKSIKSKKLIAHWLFICALPQRGGVMAEDPFAPLWHLFKYFPELFDPKAVAKKWSAQEIREAIQSVGHLVGKGKSSGNNNAHALGYKLDQHAKAWMHNMTVIAERFNGNVLNVFKKVAHLPVTEQFQAAFRLVDNRKNKIRDPKTLMLRPNGFAGMRRKIFALFVIWLQKENIIPYFPCPIPVDFHALRVLLSSGVVRLGKAKPVPSGMKHMQALEGVLYQKVNEPMIDEVALWTMDFLHRNGLSHIDLNPAVWVLSRELCAAHPQNTAYKKNTRYLFPADFQKDAPIPLPRKTRANLCSHCLIGLYCDNTVPSKPYYADGNVITITRVKNLPEKPVPETLFGEFLSVFIMKGSKFSRSKLQPIEEFATKSYMISKQPVQTVEPTQGTFWETVPEPSKPE